MNNSLGTPPQDVVTKSRLGDHRQKLTDNPEAYTADLPRVREKTAVNQLRMAGYVRVTRARCAPLVDQFVNEIFETQGGKPFFHIDGSLPYCWNAPMHWTENYICYEWGHLDSRNQRSLENLELSPEKQLENLCLQSARCNQHIQTSMDIAEVLSWLEGSRVEKRVHDVLEKRRQLFMSKRWHDLLRALAPYKAAAGQVEQAANLSPAAAGPRPRGRVMKTPPAKLLTELS